MKTRSEKHSKHRRKKGCLVFLLILLLIIGVIIFNFYRQIKKTEKNIFVERAEEQVEIRQERVQISQDKQPFSVLLLGIDSGSMGRTDSGRSDIMVLATVNPTDRKTILLSIPRDTRTEIVGRDELDKINHAYAFGGIAMSANTVQELLQVPVDYSVAVDMQGFADIIDAIGGITVVSMETFSQSGYHFTANESVHLNGDMALAYIRNRYDTGGDYSRQERARQVISNGLRQVAQLDAVTNYSKILELIEDDVKTDISFDTAMNIFNHYRPALQDIEFHQLEGVGETIDGIYYDIPIQESLNSIQKLLQDQLDM